MDLQLQQRTALVTGSDRRTGEIIADTLAAEGATVVYHGSDCAPQRPLAVCGDINTEAGAAQVLAELEQKNLSIDILVKIALTRDLPQIRSLESFRPSAVTRIYSADGLPMVMPGAQSSRLRYGVWPGWTPGTSS